MIAPAAAGCKPMLAGQFPQSEFPFVRNALDDWEAGTASAPHVRAMFLGLPGMKIAEESRDVPLVHDTRRITVNVSGPLERRRNLLGLIRSEFERIHAKLGKLGQEEFVPVPLLGEYCVRLVGSVERLGRSLLRSRAALISPRGDTPARAVHGGDEFERT